MEDKEGINYSEMPCHRARLYRMWNHLSVRALLKRHPTLPFPPLFIQE
jgi:hypothetical protein